MIQPATMQFLKQLAANNNKPWFDAHKDAYDAAKADFEATVAGILKGLAAAEPMFAEQKAKDCVFRIYRDVRFAKDKTPYKAHFGAFLSRGGKKYDGAGYYIHLEPGKSFAGGGMWAPAAPLLKAVRQEIDYNLDEFEGILQHKSFKKYFKGLEGEQLKTIPQGYSADNPAIDLLKRKSFVVDHRLTDEDVTNKSFISKSIQIFSAMKSLVDFLNRPLD